MQECPLCGLINPGEALRCDCGYDFQTQSLENSYFTKEDHIPRGRLKVGLNPLYAVFSPLLFFGMLPFLLGIGLWRWLSRQLARERLSSLPKVDHERAQDIADDIVDAIVSSSPTLAPGQEAAELQNVTDLQNAPPVGVISATPPPDSSETPDSPGAPPPRR